MKKFLEKSILDELYETKSDNFAEEIKREMEVKGKKEQSTLLEEKLTNMIKKAISDEKLQSEVLKLLNEYEMKTGKESDFWNKMYYKLGVYDCAEIKKIIQTNPEKENTFFEEYKDDFIDYLEKNRMENLREREEYNKISNEISKIKEKYPNVRSFLEDNEYINLTEDELKAVLKILDLQASIDVEETKEVFRLGAKEAILSLNQMHIL